MKVVYDKPQPGTKFEVPYDYSFLKVGSAEDVKRAQEQILAITDLAAQFLSGYALPNGVDGEALVNFIGYKAKADHVGRFFPHTKTVGVVGFPTISIQTELGESQVGLHPEQDSFMRRTVPNSPYKGLGNHLEIYVSGGGLADKVAGVILPRVETIFATRPIKVETFDSPGPGYLSKRIIVPI